MHPLLCNNHAVTFLNFVSSLSPEGGTVIDVKRGRQCHPINNFCPSSL